METGFGDGSRSRQDGQMGPQDAAREGTLVTGAVRCPLMG